MRWIEECWFSKCKYRVCLKRPFRNSLKINDFRIYFWFCCHFATNGGFLMKFFLVWTIVSNINFWWNFFDVCVFLSITAGPIVAFHVKIMANCTKWTIWADSGKINFFLKFFKFCKIYDCSMYTVKLLKFLRIAFKIMNHLTVCSCWQQKNKNLKLLIALKNFQLTVLELSKWFKPMDMLKNAWKYQCCHFR